MEEKSFKTTDSEYINQRDTYFRQRCCEIFMEHAPELSPYIAGIIGSKIAELRLSLELQLTKDMTKDIKLAQATKNIVNAITEKQKEISWAAVGDMDQKISTLEQVSGLSIDALISLFSAGYALQSKDRVMGLHELRALVAALDKKENED